MIAREQQQLYVFPMDVRNITYMTYQERIIIIESLNIIAAPLLDDEDGDTS